MFHLSPECPLPDLARALDKPSHQVGRHEQTSVLRVVLVPANPQRPPFGVENLPELLHAVLVRVVGVNLSQPITIRGDYCFQYEVIGAKIYDDVITVTTLSGAAARCLFAEFSSEPSALASATASGTACACGENTQGISAGRNVLHLLPRVPRKRRLRVLVHDRERMGGLLLLHRHPQVSRAIVLFFHLLFLGLLLLLLLSGLRLLFAGGRNARE